MKLPIVYNEVSIKKPLFGVGDPEPKLKDDELFLYRSQSGEYFVVEPARTPVSNHFIKKRKIDYRIKMNGGPFTYKLTNRLIRSRDHRKRFKVDLFLKLEIEDAERLYLAKVNDVSSYVHQTLPKQLASILGSYELHEISIVTKKLEDVDAYPNLVDDLRGIGLKVINYEILVDKDDLENRLDQTDRETDAKIAQDVKVKTAEAALEVEIEGTKKVKKVTTNLKVLEHYDRLLEQHDPETVLQNANPEDVPKLTAYWERKGILKLDAPDNERSKKLGSLMDDDDLI